MLKTAISTFARNEDAAVTTDWVVLTGVAFLLAAALVVSVRVGAVNVGTQTNTSLEAATLPPIGGL